MLPNGQLKPLKPWWTEHDLHHRNHDPQRPRKGSLRCLEPAKCRRSCFIVIPTFVPNVGFAGSAAKSLPPLPFAESTVRSAAEKSNFVICQRKSLLMTIETIIRNGLRVLVSGDVFDPEPDVGLPRQFVDNLKVTFLSGDEFPFELSDEDDQRLVDELVAAYNEPPWDV